MDVREKKSPSVLPLWAAVPKREEGVKKCLWKSIRSLLFGQIEKGKEGSLTDPYRR